MSTASATQPSSRLPVRRIIARGIVRTSIFLAVLAAIMFLSAGRATWLRGWLYIAFCFVMMAFSTVVLGIRAPGLLLERAGAMAKGNAKRWDLLLAPLMAMVGPLAIVLVAGFDERYGWSSSLPATVQGAGFVLALLGSLLTLASMLANHFFSSLVRIQSDRSHAVATGGPYRYLRHPGYAGMTLFNLGTPLILDSLWSYMVVGAVVVVTLIRTVLEDRTLQRELPGYADYARRVRYRLMPGIW